jgi:DNA-binding MarR family transcriptional regulator
MNYAVILTNFDVMCISILNYIVFLGAFYRIYKIINNLNISLDEFLFISFLYNQWNLNIDTDSKSIIKHLPRYSKSTIHRKLNDLRTKNIIDYQVDYYDGRKIKIIKGSEYQKLIDNIELNL